MTYKDKYTIYFIHKSPDSITTGALSNKNYSTFIMTLPIIKFFRSIDHNFFSDYLLIA